MDGGLVQGSGDDLVDRSGFEDSADRAPAERLLAWYDVHRRRLPWRAEPGGVADPYAVWLSEVMLQQTTVAAVKGYYAAFLRLWPTVGDLAAAPVETVMERWAGLGYYSRARNLHACARVVAETGGRFPDSEEALRALPGVGAYTAAAVAAIAFDRRAVVVDGNVERVIARLQALPKPIRDSRPAIRAHANAMTPARRCGDFAQAMMDLGATICTPRRPTCPLCPLERDCDARRLGRENDLPVRAAKPDRPLRHGSVFYLRRSGSGSGSGSDEVLVRTREPRGLLGGMVEFPGSAWDAEGDPRGDAAPLPAAWLEGAAPVEHGFTHFALRLTVFAATAARDTEPPEGWRFVPESGLASLALPTLMRNVAVAAQAMLAAPVQAPLLAGVLG